MSGNFCFICNEPYYSGNETLIVARRIERDEVNGSMKTIVWSGMACDACLREHLGLFSKVVGRMTEYIVECYYDVDGGLIPGEYREEIVRCRDCKHGDKVVWPKSWNVPDDYLDCTGYLVTTWDYYNDETKSNPVPPDGFCAWGERIDNDSY